MILGDLFYTGASCVDCIGDTYAIFVFWAGFCYVEDMKDNIENDFQKYNDLMEGLACETPQIVLAYIFGSTANNACGPMSDYDFAVYLDEPDKKKRYDIKFQLIGKLSSALKNNKVDVVVINDTDNINLKYAIISEGKIIFEKEPHKVVAESKILNEYFDFRIFIDTYQKTK